MAVLKRDRWTELDVVELPAGEHDYFERKSGDLFNKTDDLLGKLAKTVSALANSGGGHVILGVADDGTPDGVPPTYGKGKQSTRDWLEQKIPNLMTYTLADFRVHVVERAEQSEIPVGRDVIVIDVGDSALAPHQCAYGGGGAQKHVYYYRQAGRSDHAPHFYLELLRQRLVNPTLEAEVVGFKMHRFGRAEKYQAFLLAARLDFVVRNTGRVAAYKWQIAIDSVSGAPPGREQDYSLPFEDQHVFSGMGNGVRIDDTILPGGAVRESVGLPIILRPETETGKLVADYEAFATEYEAMMNGVTLNYRVATETSPGNIRHIDLSPFLSERPWPALFQSMQRNPSILK
jgi:hypothetical protein